MPSGASRCPSGPLTRWPDYWVFNIAVGYTFGGVLGAGGSATVDRYGRLYGALAPLSLGEGLPTSAILGLPPIPISFNLSGGWVCQEETPGREELQGFLTGWASNVNIGAGAGFGVVESASARQQAVEAGVYWPQIGGSIYYSFFIVDLSTLLQRHP